MQQEVPELRFATTRLAGGLRVHFGEQGDPGGEPIVLLPAYTDSWFSWSRVLPLLAPRYHAYALDQRGHGDSDRPGCCYAVEDFAADVVGFLDAVGVGRATLVGHSGSCLVAGRRRTIWRSRSGGPAWSCIRRRATAPTGNARSGSPPTWTPSCTRPSRQVGSPHYWRSRFR
jgi:hypothetical protein